MNILDYCEKNNNYAEFSFHKICWLIDCLKFLEETKSDDGYLGYFHQVIVTPVKEVAAHCSVTNSQKYPRLDFSKVISTNFRISLGLALRSVGTLMAYLFGDSRRGMFTQVGFNDYLDYLVDLKGCEGLESSKTLKNLYYLLLAGKSEYQGEDLKVLFESVFKVLEKERSQKVKKKIKGNTMNQSVKLADINKSLDHLNASVFWPKVKEKSEYSLNNLNDKSLGMMVDSMGKIAKVRIVVLRPHRINKSSVILDFAEDVLENDFFEVYEDVSGAVKRDFLSKDIKKRPRQFRVISKVVGLTLPLVEDQVRAEIAYWQKLYFTDKKLLELFKVNFSKEEDDLGKIKVSYGKIIKNLYPNDSTKTVDFLAGQVLVDSHEENMFCVLGYTENCELYVISEKGLVYNLANNIANQKLFRLWGWEDEKALFKKQLAEFSSDEDETNIIKNDQGVFQEILQESAQVGCYVQVLENVSFNSFGISFSTNLNKFYRLVDFDGINLVLSFDGLPNLFFIVFMSNNDVPVKVFKRIDVQESFFEVDFEQVQVGDFFECFVEFKHSGELTRIYPNKRYLVARLESNNQGKVVIVAGEYFWQTSASGIHRDCKFEKGDPRLRNVKFYRRKVESVEGFKDEGKDFKKAVKLPFGYRLVDDKVDKGANILVGKEWYLPYRVDTMGLVDKNVKNFVTDCLYQIWFNREKGTNLKGYISNELNGYDSDYSYPDAASAFLFIYFVPVEKASIGLLDKGLVPEGYEAISFSGVNFPLEDFYFVFTKNDSFGYIYKIDNICLNEDRDVIISATANNGSNGGPGETVTCRLRTIVDIDHGFAGMFLKKVLH